MKYRNGAVSATVKRYTEGLALPDLQISKECSVLLLLITDDKLEA